MWRSTFLKTVWVIWKERNCRCKASLQKLGVGLKTRDSLLPPGHLSYQTSMPFHQTSFCSNRGGWPLYYLLLAVLAIFVHMVFVAFVLLM